MGIEMCVILILTLPGGAFGDSDEAIGDLVLELGICYLMVAN